LLPARGEAGAPRCGGGENAAVADHVEARRGNQGGQPLQKFQRLEDNAVCPVAPASLQMISNGNYSGGTGRLTTTATTTVDGGEGAKQVRPIRMKNHRENQA
jgi:hypothetical protein